MSVHDVPRRRWMEVLEEFSRDHRGWLASVVTVGPDPELVSSTTLRPLESVTVGPDEGRPTALRVGFQGGPAVFVTAPRTLAVDRRHDGAERALEINAADATFVRIAFRATALPEELDAIAPTELTAGPARLKS